MGRLSNNSSSLETSERNLGSDNGGGGVFLSGTPDLA